MVLHASLLTVQLLVVVMNTIPHRFIATWYYKLQIVLVIVDTILQLAICYICWTMGSSVELRRYNLTLVSYGSGNSVSLKYTLKGSKDEPLTTETDGNY